MKHIGLAACCGLVAFACAMPAHATDGASSLYLLGSGGPGAAVMAPVEGVYYDKTLYVYDGDAAASREFPVNNQVVVGLDTTVVVDFETLLFVPSTKFLGGTLALGGTLPVGAPMLDVDAVLTRPGGPELSAARHDSTLTVGDPVGLVMLGWHGDKFHAQLSSMINVPVGHYREGQLANLSLHRWAVDGSLALSWHDPGSGWDLSVKGGYTYNDRNRTTDYDSGDEAHVEAAIEKALSPKFSLGVQGYYFKQVSDDRNGQLGPFRGEALAVGGTAAFNVTMGKSPATFRARFLHELETTNRLEGNSFWLDFAIPLKMNLPPQ